MMTCFARRPSSTAKVQVIRAALGHIWAMLAVMRIVSALMFLVACSRGTPGPASPGKKAEEVEKATPAEFERTDVSGSKKLGRDAVLARWGDRLARIARHPEQAESKQVLEVEIAAARGFAFVDICSAPRTRGAPTLRGTSSAFRR